MPKSRRFRVGIIVLIALLGALAPVIPSAADEKAQQPVVFPFKSGDRVAWIGSSSTTIGQYCQCMEFLLRTRHPEAPIVCRRYSNIYMDTFAKCAPKLPGWLAEFKPTIVFFQYGGNDSVLGEAGLAQMKSHAAECVALARAAGAKVFLITPQGVDIRKVGDKAKAKFSLDNFYLYAEKLVVFGREEGWTVLDTHQPLVKLLEDCRKDDPEFTYTVEKTHMTAAGYVAWGFIQYRLLNPPAVESRAELSADGKVLLARRCKIHDVTSAGGVLSFTRDDEVLPILPPVALPPRAHVALESNSRYILKISGLPAGTYDVSCEGKPIGQSDAKSLEAGVNLNTLLLDSKQPAPWDDFAKQIWTASKQPLGKGTTGSDPIFAQIGKTQWKFEVRRRS